MRILLSCCGNLHSRFEYVPLRQSRFGQVNRGRPKPPLQISASSALHRTDARFTGETENFYGPPSALRQLTTSQLLVE